MMAGKGDITGGWLIGCGLLMVLLGVFLFFAGIAAGSDEPHMAKVLFMAALIVGSLGLSSLVAGFALLIHTAIRARRARDQ